MTLCHNSSISDVEQYVASANLASESDLNICRGHDFVDIFCTILEQTHMIDAKNKQSLFAKMRDAYSYSDFHKTQLYDGLMNWQLSHSRQILL